jgi:hypothetical protein
MKRVMVIFCLSVLACLAQAKDAVLPNFPKDAAGSVVFQEVIQVPGTTAAELRARARAWIAMNYRSALKEAMTKTPSKGADF